MKISVVVFPGTNCEHDVVHLYKNVLGATVHEIWHRDTDLKSPDVVIVPGGFSYGDYLRTGAMAKLSPVMGSVTEFAAKGGLVLGICNGFQILCEAGLLPGVLLQNAGMKFLSRFIHMRVENNTTPFTKQYARGSIINCPIAHFEGNYFIDDSGLEELEKNNQVIFRYCNEKGETSDGDLLVNVNGSRNSIAGVSNKAGNVVGLMPHPERAAEMLIGYIGSETGRAVFAS